MELTAFELSYIDEKIPIKLDKEGYFDINEKILDLLKEKLTKIRQKVANVHLDGGNFEVDSPVFYDKNSAIEYYEYITKLMKSQRLVTHSTKTDGGGLHFHINLPAPTYISVVSHMCYVMNRLPYLNWIFNNPIDTWNANNAFLNFKTNYNIALNSDTVDDISLFMLKGNKSTPLRFEESGTNRVEYRFFDMPYNRIEFGLLLDFIDALHETLINRRWPEGHLSSKELINCQTLSRRFMIAKFKTLLEDLKLEYKDYDIFIQRNMNTRYKYGKKYLV